MNKIVQSLLYRNKRLLNFFRKKVYSIAAQKIFWHKYTPLIEYSKIFDSRDLPKFKKLTYRMMGIDDVLLERLSEKRLKGLRCWEYGILLNFMLFNKCRDWKVLDVGPGNSGFPLFLSMLVNKVTTLDYEKPLEPPSQKTLLIQKGRGIINDYGSMPSLTYQNGQFDLVTCISTIEHLDEIRSGKQLEYQQFLSNTIIGLSEMMRVVKKNGYIYITSDAYVPDLASIDIWSRKRQPGNIIWSAYKFEDIANIFLKTLTGREFEIIGNSGFSKQDLINSDFRNSYRGRYFTTFAILAKKNN